MAGGLFGLLEQVGTGRNLGKDLSKYADYFKNAGYAGTALTNEGLADLRNLSGSFQDQINAGGLTPALNREYDVQRGRISDDAVRATRSFRASIAQQAAQNGGYLSPAAQAELERRNAADVSEQSFKTSNDLAFEEARVKQESTTQLQNNILRIADMVRSTGLTREQQAQMGMLNVAQLMYQRNKAIDESMRSWFGGFAGGFGGH